MKTRKILMCAFPAFLVAAFLGGCRDENMETIGVCPIVVATTPINSAAGVPLNGTITVTFNTAMNPATITQEALTVLAPGEVAGGRVATTQISGIMTYDAITFTMKFVPSTKLKANTTYTGTVATSVKDPMGNALQTPYIWSFSTSASVAPTVVSTDPLNNATGVVTNKIEAATFSVPMDPSTMTATTFTLKQGATPIAGTVSYSGSTASFNPTSSLASNTVYTATITTGAKDAPGTAMAANYVWTFTTGMISAPKVNSTDPLNLATNIPLNKTISAVFSEVMDALSITSSSFTLMTGGYPVAGTVNYAGTTATFTPTGNLLSGSTYTATLTTNVKNPAGTPITSNYVWTFSTSTSLGPLAPDLKSVGRFGIIAGTGVSNNAGFSEIRNLDVGISPGVRSSITGFPPAIIVNGAMFASDDIAPPGVAAMLIQAKQDLTDAYLFAEGATSPAPATVAGDQGGLTLAPGIYKSTSTLLIQSGDLTLDAQGDANAVWIFQIAADFTTVGGAGGNVILIGGAQAKNVYWQVGSSATIGNNTAFKGNIMALTSITMNANAVAVGRMLARNGAVVMTSTNIIEKP
jgi:hypothetical protein